METDLTFCTKASSFPSDLDEQSKPQGFPGASDGKESAGNAGDPGSISGSGKSPGGGHGYPLQYSCLENPHGQKSLVSYSSWGCTESDMTEQYSILILNCFKYESLNDLKALRIFNSYTHFMQV